VTKSEAHMKLRDLLFKLGIKSAEVDFIERASLNMVNNYGRPDMLIMPGAVLESFLKMMENKDD